MPTLSPWDPKLRPDVAILIALPEEFQSLADEYEHQWHSQANPNHPGHDFLFVGPGDYRCVVTIMPRKGPVMASQTSIRLLAWKPSVILNVGIAGGFKNDVCIGDVIVPQQVAAYDETGKIKNRRWERRGLDYRPSPGLVTAVQQLQYTSRDAYARWKKAGSDQLAKLRTGADQVRVNALLKHGQIRKHPIISTNHLASGSFVVASKSFAEFIRRANADIHAGEMEAAGMMAAAEYWSQGPMTLVVRGISDHVNADKNELDAIGDGALRKLAMANAWRLVCTLMTLDLLPRSEGRATHRLVSGLKARTTPAPANDRKALKQVSARVNEIADKIQDGAFPAGRIGQCEALELGYTSPTLKLPDSFGQIANQQAYLESLTRLKLTTKESPPKLYRRWCAKLDKKFRNDPNVYLESHIRTLESVCAAHPCDYAMLQGYKKRTGKRLIRASADVLAVSADGRFVHLLHRGFMSNEAEGSLNTFGGLVDPTMDGGSLLKCAIREFREETGYREGALSLEGCPVLLQLEKDFNVSTVVFLGVSVVDPIAHESQEGRIFSVDLTNADAVFEVLANGKWVDSGRQSLLTWFALGCPVQGQPSQTISKEYAEELFRRGLLASRIKQAPLRRKRSSKNAGFRSRGKRGI